MIVQIVDEFRSAGWYVTPLNIPNGWMATPNPRHHKTYYLFKVGEDLGEDWVLSSKFQHIDPQYDEALNILNRARLKVARKRASPSAKLKAARDRTRPNAIAQSDLYSTENHSRGNMPSIVRLSNGLYINFDDVRRINIHSDPVTVAVTWRGEKGATSTFKDEDARKIMAFAELFAAFTFYELKASVNNPPDELTKLG